MTKFADGPPIKQTYSRKKKPKKQEGTNKTRGAIGENHQSITNSDSGLDGGA
ncbi:uncharacterized protein G2W53_011037 [Senna tora]|uniref:Uncharacterized protein n=1 Tax=Senna tora TaxID=362788 RepID=A0A834X112_9FABA|nr:uncharacterized protein G2W53_011037 [Senna tora]